MGLVDISTCVTPWVALIMGGQYFMAGVIHSYKPDGGKYSIAGFNAAQFNSYQHAVMMFWSAYEGSFQLVDGCLLIAGSFLLTEYIGAFFLYDAVKGIVLTIQCGIVCGGVAPLPLPAMSESKEGMKAPGSKLMVVKTLIGLTFGLMWFAAGKPALPPLPWWALIISFVQVTALISMFWKVKIPDQAMDLVNGYKRGEGFEYQPFA